jgi:hypothetical protein
VAELLAEQRFSAHVNSFSFFGAVILLLVNKSTLRMLVTNLLESMYTNDLNMNKECKKVTGWRSNDGFYGAIKEPLADVMPSSWLRVATMVSTPGRSVGS